MKKLIWMITLLVLVSSCDVLKQSVSTTAELFVGELNGQPVKYEDKNGYLNHFIDMKLPGFWAEYVKGVTFAPINDFDFEISDDNSLGKDKGFRETDEGKKLVWVPLFGSDGELLIKPYRRELH